ERRDEQRAEHDHEQADREVPPEQHHVEEPEHLQALGDRLDSPTRRLLVDQISSLRWHDPEQWAWWNPWFPHEPPPSKRHKPARASGGLFWLWQLPINYAPSAGMTQSRFNACPLSLSE